ncbi:hypothetical protein B4N89_20815 [Embleya scabrispora]|uniref:Uncharacterized protein n=1 Tax=Embleya scabrispora TaxID=159449 RepID=A0A1T3P269_9ACTN|nr:hypothetical protein [Embleya scabrispora]OPC83055.1 hypothetical protein B4N89_20815 [Embleya scabrispora]
MTPDDYDALEAEALDEPTFSNGTEGYGWMAANCDTCVHDKPIRDDSGPGCPLLLIAMIGKRPVQWLDGPRGETGLFSIATQYVCTEYRDEDDGPDPTPRPIPDPPGQGVLLPREPYTGHRVLASTPVMCRCGDPGVTEAEMYACQADVCLAHDYLAGSFPGGPAVSHPSEALA